MSTLVRWEPFHELAQLQGEMGRLLNGLHDNRANQSWVPSLDVWETDNQLVHAFDLPGLDEDRISIEVHDDTLTVNGERQSQTSEDSDRFYRVERRTARSPAQRGCRRRLMSRRSRPRTQMVCSRFGFPSPRRRSRVASSSAPRTQPSTQRPATATNRRFTRRRLLGAASDNP
jgi:hypothetical protein